MKRRWDVFAWPAMLVGVAGCAELVTDIVDFAVVEVSATRLSGDPVPGAEITLRVWPPRELGVGLTDRNGRLTFEYVPPENSYAVQGVPPEGYKRPEEMYGGPSTEWVEGLWMEPGDRRQIEFKYLKVGPGSIAASVSDPAGEPIEGVRLSAYTPTGTVFKRTTDAAGAVLFEGVPFGHWGVRAFPAEGYFFGANDVQYRDGFVIEEGVRREARFVMDFTGLTRCYGTVRAQVSDQYGEPVEDYPLRLYTYTRTVATGSTEPDGRYAFTGLFCDGYGVSLETRRGFVLSEGRGSTYIDALTVGVNTDTIDVSFTAPRCAGFIRATVVDPLYAPMPGVRVILYTSSQTLEAETSDDLGIATFSEITCGVEHGVRVDPPSGYVPLGPDYRDALTVRHRGVAWATLVLEERDTDLVRRFD